MITKIRAVKDVADVEVDVRATEDGILAVADVSRFYTARGYGWQAMATSAIASLVVRPSTLSMLTLYNNGATNYVLDKAFAHNLVAAANCFSSLWLCVHPVGMTAPGGNNITVRNSLSGLTAGTAGIVDTAEAVTDNGWFPWGKQSHTITVTTPGGVLMANIEGRIVIPPTAGISVTVVSSVTTATFTTGFRWFSVPVSEMAVG